MTRVVMFDEGAAEKESMIVHQSAYGNLKQKRDNSFESNHIKRNKKQWWFNIQVNSVIAGELYWYDMQITINL